MVIQGRFPMPWSEDDVPEKYGWRIPEGILSRAIDNTATEDEGVWFVVRDKETGEIIDREKYGLYIRIKNQPETPEGVVFVYYGGGPDIDDDEGDGWFDDFPPIPPGP
jgi:hypothetical protein